MTRAGGSDATGATDRGTVAVLGKDVLDLDVPVRPDAVAAVRHAVVDHLEQRAVPTAVIDDIELVISELVTNAIIHPQLPERSDRAVQVRVAVSDGIDVVVSNHGDAGTIPGVDEWAPAPAFAPSGRGLGIVRRLCDEVSVDQSGEWAVITCRRRLPDGGTKP